MNKNPFNIVNTINGVNYDTNEKKTEVFYTQFIISKRDLLKEAEAKSFVLSTVKVSSKRKLRSGV